MTTVRGAHLVGSLKAASADEAFSVAARTLGGHLSRLTDGETGARSQWIGWQLGRLATVPGIELGTLTPRGTAGAEEYAATPTLVVTPGVEIPAGTLGYAEAAVESYAAFRSLRDDGRVPAGIRFQVSLPTPYAVVVAWATGPSQRALWPAYRAALFAEARAIQAAIPAQDLAIQWDVAVEVGVLHGVFDAVPELADVDRIVGELVACLELVQPPVERGLHLCYGDLRHRHFVSPTDLSVPVRLANAVAERIAFDFLHLPVDRENGLDPAYFAPLADLRTGAELALGVIDYEHDPARTDALVAAAAAAGRDFAVATECGLGRVGERGESVTLQDLLGEHARVAATVR